VVSYNYNYFYDYKNLNIHVISLIKIIQWRPTRVILEVNSEESIFIFEDYV
jgi:hypothetical protein